ncbi:MAG: hypothetical protein QW568_04685 [Candidatus Anstonellaceae archaeon]
MGEKKNEAESQPSQGGLFEPKNLMMPVLVALILVVGFNQYQIATLSSLPVPKEVVVVQGTPSGTTSQTASVQGTQQSIQSPGTLAAPANNIMPSGVPAIYGEEIGVKYEDISSANPNVQATIDKLTNLLGGEPGNVLKGADLERYTKIGSMIACEYCCGAKTLVFNNGQPACGCAHSYAMRGVLGYLVKNHPDMTDDQILEEIGKWKVLFFPGPEQSKAVVLAKANIPLTYINLASNKYRGAESGAAITPSGTSGASQVGGC